MQQLLLATHNCHKVEEFRQILGDRFEILDMSVLPELSTPDETGATFEENARLKASHAAAHYSGMVLADDSGLEVDALGGAPGVLSARYAGLQATDADNVARLLADLEAFPDNRSARFCCVIACAGPTAAMFTVSGAVEGKIRREPAGATGFGYDPVFEPQGCFKTFAELSPVEKNCLSHRAAAIERLAAILSAH